jgi:DUF1680 family protein
MKAQLGGFLLAGVVAAMAVGLSLRDVAGQAAAPVAAAGAADHSKATDLAIFAKTGTSYVSGHESLDAINGGFTPRNSRDHRHGAYGNWPQTGTQWVEYEWPKAVSTNKVDVYWWQDGQGIHLPTASRLLYWDGSAFKPVENAHGLGVAPNTFNTTQFDEVMTTKLRLEFDGDGAFSTGILAWKVYDSGKSPAFPTRVTAGIDRTVVLPGKTYLNGTTRGPAVGLAWSKESGPGEVTLADASAASTTADFSAPGDYVLKFTSTSGELSSADELHVKVLPALTIPRLEPVYTKSYTIDSPLWNSRMKPLIVAWIPHCIDEIEDPNLKEGGLSNFIEAGNKLAGRPAKPHVGYPFSNAWVHNMVESMCVALQVNPQGDAEIEKAQARMRTTLEKWIPIILAAQEPDGYMQTRFTLGTPREAASGRLPGHWTLKTEHEGYVGGYFLESAIAHYLLTDGKDRRLYDAAKRLADCWCNNIGPAPKKTWYDGHEEMEQALVRFGRFVNDVEGGGRGDKYVTLAKFLLDARRNGEQYDQTHLPVVQQYEAVGHAVRAAYLYSGMADVATETHDVDYQSAVQSLWDDLVNRKWYLTGGIGSGETSEGFGKDYSLPNNSYCESCSNCGALFFQWKMNMAYHQAKYADLYEETLYNAILGDFDLSGHDFTYTNPLESSQERYAWHVCPCCVGNFPRTLLMLPTWMYSKGADGLYVNLFVGSTVNVQNVAGTDVQMVQKTDYPWNGQVAITVNPASPKMFALRVRIPNRTVSTLYSTTSDVNGMQSLSVNGQALTPVVEDGYAVIAREWKAGDTVRFELPMLPYRVKAIDRVAADRGRVAIKFGPLVYNVEAADNNLLYDAAQGGPDGNVLASDSALTTEWKPELLGGVVVVKGQWTNGSALTAVPNFARDNRGGRSIVWMRD